MVTVARIQMGHPPVGAVEERGIKDEDAWRSTLQDDRTIPVQITVPKNSDAIGAREACEPSLKDDQRRPRQDNLHLRIEAPDRSDLLLCSQRLSHPHQNQYAV